MYTTFDEMKALRGCLILGFDIELCGVIFHYQTKWKQLIINQHECNKIRILGVSFCKPCRDKKNDLAILEVQRALISAAVCIERSNRCSYKLQPKERSQIDAEIKNLHVCSGLPTKAGLSQGRPLST